jgi:hypothetical protein
MSSSLHVNDERPRGVDHGGPSRHLRLISFFITACCIALRKWFSRRWWTAHLDSCPPRPPTLTEMRNSTTSGTAMNGTNSRANRRTGTLARMEFLSMAPLARRKQRSLFGDRIGTKAYRNQPPSQSVAAFAEGRRTKSAWRNCFSEAIAPGWVCP